VTFEVVTLVLVGAVTNPYILLRRGRVFEITGVPKGFYVAIRKRNKWRPLSVDEIVKASDIIALVRENPQPETVRVTFKGGR
jgi:hypothetical protein